MKGYWQKSNFYLFIIILFVSSSCKQPATSVPYQKLKGQTWGTYYRVTCQVDDISKVDNAIKLILKDFDSALSTYMPNSAISGFNKSEVSYEFSNHQDRYFAPVLKRSKELYLSTNGYLDVTVLPLLNYWGFGYKSERRSESEVDKGEVSKLKNLLGLDKINRNPSKEMVLYTKENPNVEIDFSSLAKGYGIDVIAEYLNEQGIENYLIDIGGEAKSKGVNDQGKVWTLAINKPYADAAYTTQELVLQLPNKAIATSGNYREMYIVDGKVFGHILNPKTGYPEPSDVLSASVIADDCMTADGLATACVAAGLIEAQKIIEKHPGVSACFIYDADGDKKLEKSYIGNFEKYVLVTN